MEVLKSIGLKILSALVTEKFLKKLALFALKKLVESTKNNLDDEIYKMVEEGLKD